MKHRAFILIILLVLSANCKPKNASESQGGSMETLEEGQQETGVTTFISDEHNSRNSLDWNGTYQGVVPCSDCEGIKTRLTLMKHGEFIRTLVYLGKETSNRTDKGTFMWDDSGSVVTLLPEEGDRQMYQVGENILFHLDREGNRIEGDLSEKYQLMKNKADYRLEDKKWMLTELMGQEISLGEGQTEPFLIFQSESGRVSGNNSCNVLNGGYELKEGDRIAIGQLAATLKACPDMQIADQFNQVLGKVDNYAIADGVLSLNKARMAPLARFRLQED